MTHKHLLGVAITLSLSLFAACKGDDAAQKGVLGESCTRRDDCGAHLACIDNRCVAESTGDGADAGTAKVTGGGLSESCTRRADCQPGLACLDQVCASDLVVTPDGGVAQQRGERGETCTARNDCKTGLACVSGRCRENDYDLTVQAKECHRVECETAANCCEDFTPSSSCASYKANCESTADPFYCQFANGPSCVCKRVCQDSLCLIDSGCTGDTDCSFGAPYCVNKTCVACKATPDCTSAGVGVECVDGQCKKPCVRNEQCAAFAACQAGKCIHVGCISDRECYFATNEPRSKCMDTECVTPCDNDSECTLPFNVCDKGQCVFVGCENNEECRVVLDVYSEEKVTAVCRAPIAM